MVVLTMRYQKYIFLRFITDIQFEDTKSIKNFQPSKMSPKISHNPREPVGAPWLAAQRQAVWSPGQPDLMGDNQPTERKLEQDGL